MNLKVCCTIKAQPHYRADAFRHGLKRIGGVFVDHKNCDLLVTWNRYGGFRSMADAVERRGGVVLVTENGYLGNEFAGDRWYAIARNHHNGAGQWPDGGPERWDSLGIAPLPFRTGGHELVLLPQRGIGPAGVAMPSRWARNTLSRIGHAMPTRIRAHPGKYPPAVPLEEDLRDAHAVSTWGSGAALKALLLGIPVFHGLPAWIGAPAARLIDQFDEGPRRDDAARLAMFRRMIWAQWRLHEIETGEAFAQILGL